MTKKQVKKKGRHATITSIKGFKPDWACRGFKFAPGQTYTVEGKARCCEHGFHACPDDLHPLTVFRFYPPSGSRFAIVEQSGNICRADSNKAASTVLTIKTEIGISDLVQRAWDYLWSRARIEDGGHATGDLGASSATGYQEAASATGTYGAASSTGENGVAMACGYKGRAMGTVGNALFLAERDVKMNIIAVWAGIVGRDGIEPDVWYSLRDGKPVKVEG